MLFTSHDTIAAISMMVYNDVDVLLWLMKDHSILINERKLIIWYFAGFRIEENLKTIVNLNGRSFDRK